METSANVAIDRIVLFVEHVDHYYFSKMLNEYNARHQIEHDATYWVASQYSAYYHNVTIRPIGADTSVYIGYAHNAARRDSPSAKRMKIEFNPAKLTVAQAQMLFRPLQHIIGDQNDILLKSVDIAYDIADIPLHGIHVVSHNGAREMRYATTRYFGQRSRDGRLKIYDKAAEQHLEDTVLTRVEYTAVLDPPRLIDDVRDVPPFALDGRYTVSVGDVTRGDDALMYASTLAIARGDIMLRDFSKHWQQKIKAALTSQTQLDLDGLLAAVWRQEIAKVTSVIY